ncbi:MAG: SDR family oxidoreductase, partial [Gaiellaceae bacterium]
MNADPRVVVVTGGGKGIGRAVVARFAAAGEHVVAVGRDRATLEATEASTAEVCDVTDEDQVAALFARVGPVDVLVVNAGASTSAPLGRTTLDDWQALLDVNATGAFLCTRAVVGGMIERGSGRI